MTMALRQIYKAWNDNGTHTHTKANRPKNTSQNENTKKQSKHTESERATERAEREGVLYYVKKNSVKLHATNR